MPVDLGEHGLKIDIQFPISANFVVRQNCFSRDFDSDVKVMDAYYPIYRRRHPGIFRPTPIKVFGEEKTARDLTVMLWRHNAFSDGARALMLSTAAARQGRPAAIGRELPRLVKTPDQA